MNRLDLQQLTELRLAEAQLLLDQKMPSGAYYLAGDAVECALKARIAKLHSREVFPSKSEARWVYTHNPRDLLRIAGLDSALTEFSARNPAFNANWAIVLEWSEESRYALWTFEQAQVLLQAIEDKVNGAMPWIKLHW